MSCGDKAGTHTGVMRHRNNGEQACEPCRAFYSEYQRRRYHERKHLKKCKNGHPLVRTVGSKRFCNECYGFNPDKCGTPAGVGRHERYKVPICDACRKVRRDQQRARRGKTHCRCGLEFTQDAIGRNYCRPCRAAGLRKRWAESRQLPDWLDEYRSLTLLSYSDKEIARMLKIPPAELANRLQKFSDAA